MRFALGIPVVEVVVAEAFASHLAVAIDMGSVGETMVICALNQVPYDKARNFTMNEALKAECDLLMFVDSDLTRLSGAFPKLLETLKRHDAVVASGHYCQRGYPFASTWTKMSPTTEGRAGRISFRPGSGVVDIDACGMGCALIDLRWVHEHLEMPYFQTRPSLIDDNVTVGEDTDFCLKVRALNGRIVGDCAVSAGHLYMRQEILHETADQFRRHHLEVEGILGCDLDT